MQFGIAGGGDRLGRLAEIDPRGARAVALALHFMGGSRRGQGGRDKDERQGITHQFSPLATGFDFWGEAEFVPRARTQSHATTLQAPMLRWPNHATAP